MSHPNEKEHRITKSLREVRLLVDQVMPHVERIEEIVQEHMELFGAELGSMKIERAADFLERYVNEYGEGCMETGQRIDRNADSRTEVYYVERCAKWVIDRGDKPRWNKVSVDGHRRLSKEDAEALYDRLKDRTPWGTEMVTRIRKRVVSNTIIASTHDLQDTED